MQPRLPKNKTENLLKKMIAGTQSYQKESKTTSSISKFFGSHGKEGEQRAKLVFETLDSLQAELAKAEEKEEKMIRIKALNLLNAIIVSTSSDLKKDILIGLMGQTNHLAIAHLLRGYAVLTNKTLLESFPENSVKFAYSILKTHDPTLSNFILAVMAFEVSQWFSYDLLAKNVCKIETALVAEKTTADDILNLLNIQPEQEMEELASRELLV